MVVIGGQYPFTGVGGGEVGQPILTIRKQLQIHTLRASTNTAHIDG